MEIDEYKKIIRDVQNDLKKNLKKENTTDDALNGLFNALSSHTDPNIEIIKTNVIEYIAFLAGLFGIIGKQYLISLFIFIVNVHLELYKKQLKMWAKSENNGNTVIERKSTKADNIIKKCELEIKKMEIFIEFLNSITEEEANMYLKHKM